MTANEKEAWYAIRKAAGLKIDPETAKVIWYWGMVLDPYGLYPDMPHEYRCHIGRLYFARAPDSDIWVSFDDLPQATEDAIWKRQKKGRSVAEEDEGWPF
jgi:hypothetical protein